VDGALASRLLGVVGEIREDGTREMAR